MPENPIDRASEELLVLLAEALDHGFASIEDLGGPLIPFVILDQGDRKELHRMVVEDSASAIAHGAAMILAAPASALRYALTHDAYVRIGEERYDAIIVHASERSLDGGVALAQCYRVLESTHPRLERYGDVRLLDPVANYFKPQGAA
jgi:hypothetical protein